MKNKIYFIILIVSLILTFAVGPLRTYNIFENPSLSLGTLVRGMLFWGLTIYFLTKYGRVVRSYKIVLLILLGNLIPDIIVRVLMGHFIESLPSFPDTILQVLVVLSGWWYTQLAVKGQIALTLGNLLLCVGVSSYGFVLWNELSIVKNSRFDTLEVVEILKQTKSSQLSDSVINYIQDKNLIVYIGGEKDRENEIGYSFLQKVQEELGTNKNIAVLSLICLDEREMKNGKSLLVDGKYPIIYIDRDKSKLKINTLYQFYVVDRNKKIRFRTKMNMMERNSNHKELKDLQFIEELMDWLK